MSPLHLMLRHVASRGLAFLCGLLVVLAAVLPAPHPEARLFSDGWGSANFIDPNFCITPIEGQPPRMALLAKTPAIAHWNDRLALLAEYLLWGMLLPMLALAALLKLWQRPLGTPPALFVSVGLLGCAPAWFQWTLNPAFVSLRQALGIWLVERWSVTESLFVWIDGAALLLWLGGGALLLGGGTFAAVWAAARLVRLDWRALARDLMPLAAVTLFLGLTMDTALYLRGEGVNLDWLPGLRASLLTLAVGGSGWLGMKAIVKIGAGGTAHKTAASLLWLIPPALVALNGWLMFFHWTNRYHV